MSKVASKRGRGRPAKFSAGEVQSFKNIVRKNGLLAGHQLILDQKGVSVGGKFHTLTVSLPTLGKVIKQEKGGKPVELSRGRPVGTTKEVMEQRAAAEKAAKKASREAKKANKLTACSGKLPKNGKVTNLKLKNSVAPVAPAAETTAPVEAPVVATEVSTEVSTPVVAEQPASEKQSDAA